MVELFEEKAGPEGEIMVSRAGEGPALVLIHGITSGRWSWDTVTDRLAEQYELFIYDQRGHGSSRKPNHGYLLADYANDLDLVLDHFGIERPLIIGHSLGGMVTLEWAIRQPDRAKALVIEDSPMRRGGENTDELFGGWLALNAMSVEEAEETYRSNNPAMSAEEASKRALSVTTVAQGVLSDLRDAMRSHQGESVIESYRGIVSPTLLVAGDLSAGGMVPEIDVDEFKATLPNASVVTMPGVGHNLHREQPAAFLDAVLPFLADHRG